MSPPRPKDGVPPQTAALFARLSMTGFMGAGGWWEGDTWSLGLRDHQNSRPSTCRHVRGVVYGFTWEVTNLNEHWKKSNSKSYRDMRGLKSVADYTSFMLLKERTHKFTSIKFLKPRSDFLVIIYENVSERYRMQETDWIQMNHNRIQRSAFVKTVMNMWVSYKAGNFLTTWVINNLSSKTLSHGNVAQPKKSLI
jgi:hypothetical protein